MSRWTPRAVVEAEMERRRREAAPFFAVCQERGISFTRVIRMVCMRRGIEPFQSNRINGIQRGSCVLPDWLIPEVLALVGLPLSVLGPEWLAEFGAKYGVEKPAA